MRHRQTIVVLDGETSPIQTLNALRRDADLIHCPSLQNALGAIHEKHPFLVIVDASSDEAGAARFVRALRTLPLGGDFRVLLIVDSCDSLTRRFALRAGADTTLCRPFTPDQLRATVRCLHAARTPEECRDCGPRAGALRWVRIPGRRVRSGLGSAEMN